MCTSSLQIFHIKLKFKIVNNNSDLIALRALTCGKCILIILRGLKFDFPNPYFKKKKID